MTLRSPVRNIHHAGLLRMAIEPWSSRTGYGAAAQTMDKARRVHPGTVVVRHWQRRRRQSAPHHPRYVPHSCEGQTERLKLNHSSIRQRNQNSKNEDSL